jgi:hypothetical protein
MGPDASGLDRSGATTSTAVKGATAPDFDRQVGAVRHRPPHQSASRPCAKSRPAQAITARNEKPGSSPGLIGVDQRNSKVEIIYACFFGSIFRYRRRLPVGSRVQSRAALGRPDQHGKCYASQSSTLAPYTRCHRALCRGHLATIAVRFFVSLCKLHVSICR